MTMGSTATGTLDEAYQRLHATGPQAAEETFARAVEHGDEHVIKFADTAADVYARTGDRAVLAATVQAAQLIDR
jgi:hypothetical protein